ALAEAAGELRVAQARFARLLQRRARQPRVGAAVVQFHALPAEDANRHVRALADHVQAARQPVVDRVAGAGGDVATVAQFVQLVGKALVYSKLAFQLMGSDYPYFHLVAFGLEIMDQFRGPPPITKGSVENKILATGHDGIA